MKEVVLEFATSAPDLFIFHERICPEFVSANSFGSRYGMDPEVKWGRDGLEPPPPDYGLRIAPSDAEPTSSAYLASTPLR
jgi:hypothetical protein